MELSARIASLELTETFTIARGSQDTAEVVEVEIRHGDVSGFGEGAPIDRYDETAESALAYAQAEEGALADDLALEEIHEAAAGGQFAARAADRRCAPRPLRRQAGVPAARLLGLPAVGPPTSWTIWLGDPDDMARRAERRLRPVPAPQAQARRPGRPRPHPCPGGARG